jgi:hypothetical protein
MDTNTILKVFVLSKPEMTQKCNTTNTRASLVTTATTATTITSCPDAKKLKAFIRSSTNKDKQSIKNNLNGDGDDDDDVDNNDDDNDDSKLQAGNKRKSIMQDQARVRSSQCRQSTSHRTKSLGPIASPTCRKSTTTVGASLVKLKNIKAIRRKTRNDLKDIGHDPNINDAYHEIEEMYATRNEMRRQSSKVVADNRGDD